MPLYHRIQLFTSEGEPLAQWGTMGSAPGQFDSPVAVAVDRDGSVYVAELWGQRIQKLSPTGEPLAQWGTLGSAPGQFGIPGPTGVAVEREA